MKQAPIRAALTALAVMTVFATTQTLAGQAEDQIGKLMHTSFDQPDATLLVEPIVVMGDHAIAGWSQGDLGGRALLRQHHGAWSIVLCSGDGLNSTEALRQAGLRATEADALSAKLAEAETRVAPERLALLARFEGTVMMDVSGVHPRHQGAAK
jgi:hypothetical protein